MRDEHDGDPLPSLFYKKIPFQPRFFGEFAETVAEEPSEVLLEVVEIGIPERI
jgi:hypothetical protein